MYLVYLAGGIASGKSTVARELAARGAHVVDLDNLSREVTAAGSATNQAIAREFGDDVMEPDGGLCRAKLAKRAFSSEEATQRLEKIVHPAIRERLAQWLQAQDEGSVCVVEVPLLDRVADLASAADEVVCVVCPLGLRRLRAQGRGMSAQDFDARVSRQTTDDYLVAHATTVINNDKGERELVERIDDWWSQRVGTHAEFRHVATAE